MFIFLPTLNTVMHCMTATIDVGNVKGKHFLKKDYLATVLLHLMVNMWLIPDFSS